MRETTEAHVRPTSGVPAASVAQILREAAQAVEEEEDLLLMPEIAQLARVSLDTLRYWRNQGIGGPPTFRLGRRVVARRSAVLSWIAEREAAGRESVPIA